MKLLYDASPKGMIDRTHYDCIGGQLITPLTRHKNWGGIFAVDNGAYSKFNATEFLRLLKRDYASREQCLFVCSPDVVGSARRTLEAFDVWYTKLIGWPVALVAQDGIEDLPIPWEFVDAIFIGGTNAFKEAQACFDIIKTAQLLGKHTHVGRINTPRRWRLFENLGVDTCDGSGLSRFDWMIDKIEAKEWEDTPLFDNTANNN